MSKNTRNFSLVVCVNLLLIIFSAGAPFAAAQNIYETKRARAIELYKQNKFTEARPIFEELAKADPQDAQVQSYAGFLVFTLAQQSKDAEFRRKEGLRARGYLLQARNLGVDNSLVRGILESIGEDGTINDLRFSDNQEADKLLKEGEEAFGKGDFKKALAAYQKALQLDPNLYDAALYTGNVYYKSDEYAKAGEWFAKAIQIDSSRETAYRYWGDSLAKEGKTKEAKEKFIDAYVSEPYNRFAQAAFVNMAKENGTQLAHPAIKIPTNVSGGDGNVNITLDASIFDKKDKKDGSSAWMVYGLHRALWTSGKDGKLSEDFKKAYPNETKYRHSLAEEVSALRLVLTVLSEDKKVKNLDPSLATLKRLNDEGLLESYVLLARLDAGIVKDYKPYLAANRDKLRRYVVEYMMGGKR